MTTWIKTDTEAQRLMSAGSWHGLRPWPVSCRVINRLLRKDKKRSRETKDILHACLLSLSHLHFFFAKQYCDANERCDRQICVQGHCNVFWEEELLSCGLLSPTIWDVCLEAIWPVHQILRRAGTCPQITALLLLIHHRPLHKVSPLILAGPASQNPAMDPCEGMCCRGMMDEHGPQYILSFVMIKHLLAFLTSLFLVDVFILPY